MQGQNEHGKTWKNSEKRLNLCEINLHEMVFISCKMSLCKMRFNPCEMGLQELRFNPCNFAWVKSLFLVI